MKVLTRGRLLTFALFAAASLGLAQNTNSAQASSKPVQNPSVSTYPAQGRNGPASISPGTLNYVEGRVTLDGRPVAAGTSVLVQPGQTLATADGFVEVLLTPGAFLRVG